MFRSVGVRELRGVRGGVRGGAPSQIRPARAARFQSIPPPFYLVRFLQTNRISIHSNRTTWTCTTYQHENGRCDSSDRFFSKIIFNQNYTELQLNSSGITDSSGTWSGVLQYLLYSNRITGFSNQILEFLVLNINMKTIMGVIYNTNMKTFLWSVLLENSTYVSNSRNYTIRSLSKHYLTNLTTTNKYAIYIEP